MGKVPHTDSILFLSYEQFYENQGGLRVQSDHQKYED